MYDEDDIGDIFHHDLTVLHTYIHTYILIVQILTLK
jgi:hypothetical protein